MYHPILRGKRHELKAIRELASLPVANKCKPLLEPVNLALRDLAATIGGGQGDYFQSGRYHDVSGIFHVGGSNEPHS